VGATQTPTPRATKRSPDVERPLDAPSPAFAPPPGNPRFPLFDGLRGIAVLGILAFHVAEFTNALGFGVAGRFEEVAGTEAVIAFFAISGFLLYRPYVAAHARGRAGPRTSRYARRRALRILPAYWTTLTLLAIFPGIAGVFSGDWWRYYGYLQLYSQRTLGGGIPVAWTLCVEVTFYIAMPIWAAAIRRLAGGRWLRYELAALALWMALGALVQLAAAHKLVSHLVEVSLLGQCIWIAIGMAFAVASVAARSDGGRMAALTRELGARPSLCWLGAAAAYGALMVIVPGGGLFGLIAAVATRQSATTTAVKIVLEAVLVVLLITPAVFGETRRGAPRRLLAWKPVVWIGVISYSFYLWHLTIIELIATPGGGAAFSAKGLNLLGHVHAARTFVLYMVSFVVTLVVASLSYQLVELPFLRRKR
jgi:peptidoglycan/LPS O-acetylase OafA/YrhL